MTSGKKRLLEALRALRCSEGVLGKAPEPFVWNQWQAVAQRIAIQETELRKLQVELLSNVFQAGYSPNGKTALTSRLRIAALQAQIEHERFRGRNWNDIDDFETLRDEAARYGIVFTV